VHPALRWASCLTGRSLLGEAPATAPSPAGLRQHASHSDRLRTVARFHRVAHHDARHAPACALDWYFLTVQV
jgi:hypothetical protein